MDLERRRSITEIGREIAAVKDRLKSLEGRFDLLEDVVQGDPTPQQIAEGKQLGILGMLRKSEADRATLRRLIYWLLALVGTKFVADAPTSLPLFVKAVGHLIGQGKM